MSVLSRVAYEAYCKASDGKSLISGATLPAYDDQSPEIQEAWEAVADAIVNFGPPEV